MAGMIQGFIPMTPTAKGRPRITRGGRCYTPKKTVLAEKVIQAYFGLQFRDLTPLTGPLELTLMFLMDKPKSNRLFLPTVKPDIDNLCKLFCDAVNGIAWEDDKQVVGAKLLKKYADPSKNEQAGLLFQITQIEI